MTQRKKESDGEREVNRLLIHFFSFLLATLGVIFVLFWMFYFLGTPFTPKAKEYLKQIELEKELIEKIEVSLKEAGYVRKKVGQENVYIPALRINLKNPTGYIFENMEVEATFRIENKLICRGSLTIRKLDPGQKKRVFLQCIDFTGFGTVIQGVSLPQTMKDIRYFVTLRSGNTPAQASLLQGTLKFKTLSLHGSFSF